MAVAAALNEVMTPSSSVTIIASGTVPEDRAQMRLAFGEFLFR